MWFYDRQGERAGPVEPNEMTRLVQGGQVGPSTLVWREGFAGWTPAGQTELASLFGTAVPPLPPALAPVPVAVMSPAMTPVQNWAAPLQPYSTVGNQYGGTAYGPVGGVHFAGFWIRLLAYLIDVVILIVPMVLLLLVTIGMVSASSSSDNGGAAVAVGVIGGLGQLVMFLGGIAYFVLFASGGWHATPGKRMLGLQIVPARGGQVDLGQAIGRFFACYLSSLVFGIGFLMIGWMAQKRGLHDMIAETRVIYRQR